MIRTKQSCFTFLTFLICSLVCFSQAGDLETPFVVVLDAGHGGKDPGNRGNGYYEKNIALSIALKTGAIIEKNPNIKVIYTRKTDVFVDLYERAAIANKANADLFISVHCDAFTSPSAFGAGTFVLGLHANARNFEVAKRENSVIFLEEDYEQKYDGFDPNDPESVISLVLMQETYLDQSIIAANAIQQNFVNHLERKDRTVKQAGFIVLKYTYMPSVLVEAGFLTNPKEGAFLNSSKGQTQMANTIAGAIEAYYKSHQNNLQTNPVVVAQQLEDIQVESDETKTVPAAKEIENEAPLHFKVQIAASKNDLALKPYNFRGLTGLYREEENSLFRYYTGYATTYKAAKKILRQAVKKGYKSAFIVAFRGHQKVKLREVLKR